MSALEKDKDSTAVQEVRDAPAAEELLLIRVTPGHLYFKVEGMMRFFLPIALVTIICMIYRAGAEAGRREAGLTGLMAKLSPDQTLDVIAYIHHVNDTIGVLVKELQGVIESLAVLEEKYKG